MGPFISVIIENSLLQDYPRTGWAQAEEIPKSTFVLRISQSYQVCSFFFTSCYAQPDHRKYHWHHLQQRRPIKAEESRIWNCGVWMDCKALSCGSLKKKTKHILKLIHGRLSYQYRKGTGSVSRYFTYKVVCWLKIWSTIRVQLIEPDSLLDCLVKAGCLAR